MLLFPPGWVSPWAGRPSPRPGPPASGSAAQNRSMRRLHHLVTGLVLLSTMAALLGCGPEQPVWTPQALQESYEQTLADIRDVLSERLPALQWGEQKPAAAYRSGWSCIATYASYGSKVCY